MRKNCKENSGKQYQIRGKKKKKNDPGTMRNSYWPLIKAVFIKRSQMARSQVMDGKLKSTDLFFPYI